VNKLNNLAYIKLNSNQITDIYPHVENTGIGEGDVIYIYDNLFDYNDPVIIEILQILEDRGVFIDCEPPEPL
jgi:hypothetical protein